MSPDKNLIPSASIAENFFSLGLAFHHQGNIKSARELYEKALALKPHSFETLHLLGLIEAQEGNFDLSIKTISKALAINPKNVSALNDKGLALQRLQQHQAALKEFNLAITLDPLNPLSHYNKGNALQELKQFEAALNSYQSAISLDPCNPELYNNQGNALQELKQFEAALNSYQRALALEPNYRDANFNLGTLFQTQKKYEAAVACFQRVREIDQNYVDAYIHQGNSLSELGKFIDSLDCYKKALAVDPNALEARFAIAMTGMLELYSGVPSSNFIRQRLVDELDDLSHWIANHQTDDAYKTVGIHQPFFLAYHEECNRDILLKYGAICNALMMNLFSKGSTTQPISSEHGRIRIGIASSHIHNHSVWNALTKGWLLNLPKDVFEIHLFHLGSQVDSETAIARSEATSYTQDHLSAEEWASTILRMNIDVLIYPEIGMDQLTAQLASLRLAPIQMVTWGHPETTGFPTLDYFISADDFETTDSEEYYSEKLLKLPNLGSFFWPYSGSISKPNLTKLGIKKDVSILICPGSPFKYAPQFDKTLVDIAQKLGSCQLIFFNFPSPLTAVLKLRLMKTFHEAGMEFDQYVKFIPLLETKEFYGLLQAADVFLDTIGFSGFNTALQAIECGLPVVTRKSKFLRGNLASGILNRMGLAELVTKTELEYTSLVVKLATNKPYRLDIKNKIESSKKILYLDLAPIQSLADFIKSKCRPKPLVTQ